MLVWIRGLPRTSATLRSEDPDVEWGLPEHLLAAVVDALTWANYQRSDGKGPKPKPVPRPGVGPAGVRRGRTDLPPERAKEILRGYARGDYAEVSDGG